MSKIQPGHQIGPNNAGKMILRGCFMKVSQDWLEGPSGEVGALLLPYLDNRRGEATEIKLSYGDGIPLGREDGPHELDIQFMHNVVARLKGLELSEDALFQAKSIDIFEQVTDQVIVLQDEIKKYTTSCKEIGIEPMFTGPPTVIIENVKARDPVTHAQSMEWEDTDLFEGMTIIGDYEDTHANEGTYEPPTLGQN